MFNSKFHILVVEKRLVSTKTNPRLIAKHLHTVEFKTLLRGPGELNLKIFIVRESMFRYPRSYFTMLCFNLLTVTKV